MTPHRGMPINSTVTYSRHKISCNAKMDKI